MAWSQDICPGVEEGQSQQGAQTLFTKNQILWTYYAQAWWRALERWGPALLRREGGLYRNSPKCMFANHGEHAGHRTPRLGLQKKNVLPIGGQCGWGGVQWLGVARQKWKGRALGAAWDQHGVLGEVEEPVRGEGGRVCRTEGKSRTFRPQAALPRDPETRRSSGGLERRDPTSVLMVYSGCCVQERRRIRRPGRGAGAGMQGKRRWVGPARKPCGWTDSPSSPA